MFHFSVRDEHSSAADAGAVVAQEGVRAEQAAAENRKGGGREGQVRAEEVHAAGTAQGTYLVLLSSNSTGSLV